MSAREHMRSFEFGNSLWTKAFGLSRDDIAYYGDKVPLAYAGGSGAAAAYMAGYKAYLSGGAAPDLFGGAMASSACLGYRAARSAVVKRCAYEQ